MIPPGENASFDLKVMSTMADSTFTSQMHAFTASDNSDAEMRRMELRRAFADACGRDGLDQVQVQCDHVRVNRISPTFPGDTRLRVATSPVAPYPGVPATASADTEIVETLHATVHDLPTHTAEKHPAWALADLGVRAIITPLFSDTFRRNAFQNGIVAVARSQPAVERLFEAAQAGEAVRIYLEAQNVSTPRPNGFRFEINPFSKHCLINGAQRDRPDADARPCNRHPRCDGLGAALWIETSRPAPSKHHNGLPRPSLEGLTGEHRIVKIMHGLGLTCPLQAGPVRI